VENPVENVENFVNFADFCPVHRFIDKKIGFVTFS
jgi:hypothetical protein